MARDDVAHRRMLRLGTYNNLQKDQRSCVGRRRSSQGISEADDSHHNSAQQYSQGVRVKSELCWLSRSRLELLDLAYSIELIFRPVMISRSASRYINTNELSSYAAP